MKLKKLILAALFASLTAVGAFISINIGISTITLQFLFTAFAGVILGAKYGALSQAVYVALGLVGVPIYAGGVGGFQYVLRPTFGFLVGLIPAAFVIGIVASKKLTFWNTALACTAGLGLLYAIGVPYMAVICNAYLGYNMSFWDIMKTGMIIYLPGDFAKIAICAFLAPRLTGLLKKAGILEKN